jgi:glucosamine kinase
MSASATSGFSSPKTTYSPVGRRFFAQGTVLRVRNQSRGGEVTTFCGVDGGGTRTRAVVMDDAGKVVAAAESGPSNALTAGFETAMNSVREALDGVGHRPGWPTVLALAGSGRDLVRRRWEDMLVHEGLHTFLVTPDYRAAWAALNRGGPGLVAVMGTGSVVYGENAAGIGKRVGGYGFRLGDPGSGLWIAVRALRAAVMALEGWGPPTRLTSWAAAWGENPEEILAWLYREDFRPGDLAARASQVVDLARSGDGPALAIVEEGIRRVVQQMRAVAEQLDWQPAWPLGVTGGLGERLLAQLAVETAAAGLGTPRVVERPPAEGAAWLARALPGRHRDD